jgi:hypothetical protein
MRNISLAATLAMFISSGAMANNFGASVNYGLGGVGADLGYAVMADTLTLRASINSGLDTTGSTTPDATKYDYKLDTGYKSLGLDWHPFSGGFRVSAGYAWSDITLDVKTIGSYTFNGATATGTATGRIKYDNAPYLSIGWGNHAPVKGGMFFNSELGIMFTGKPSVDLTTDNETFNATNAADIQVEKEKVKKDAMDFFPILKIGVGYAF